MSRLLRTHAPALAAYAALFALALWPQSRHLADAVWYAGDGLDSAYFVAWAARQLFRAPAHLFDANLLYPNPHPAALDAHRILEAVVSKPVQVLTGNAILSANLVMAAAYLFAAMAGRRLAHALGLGPWAAWSAGALYAFHTYQVSESPRLNILCHGFLPLALVQLIAYGRSGSRRHAWAVGGLMLLQAYADNYLALYGALLLAMVAIAYVAARPRPALALAPGLVLPALVAALLFSPIALAYLRQHRVYGFDRGVPRGIDVLHYFTTPPSNVWYGHMGLPYHIQQQAPHFIGFVAIACVLVALWHRHDDEERPSLLPARVWIPSALALAVVFMSLSLGADISVGGHRLGPGPYALLHRFVPGFGFIRIPERFAMLAMLFVALLAARTVARLERRRTWAAAALALALPLEHLSPLPSIERYPVGRDVPAVYRWLADAPVRALAEVPIHGENLVRKESIEEYFSTYHWKPIIHGYVSYPPLLATVLRRAAGAFPSPDSLAVLRRVGVDTVVVHTGRAGGEAMAEAATGAALPLRARFEGPDAPPFDGGRDEVYGVPPAKDEPAAPWPAGRRRALLPGWHHRASPRGGDPAAVSDGDPATAWVLPGPVRAGDFLEITFDSPREVSGIVLPLRRDAAYPARFRVVVRTRRGWVDAARFEGPQVLQLVDQLQRDPGHASIAFDLGARTVTGVSLLADEDASGFEGWSVPELEVWEPEHTSSP